MRIKVTQEHIDRSNELACKGMVSRESCPLALAIRDATGEAWYVSLFVAVLGKKALFLSELALSFRRKFDSGKPVNPFEFDLPI